LCDFGKRTDLELIAYEDAKNFFPAEERQLG
jgi:hypothetical protein